MKTWPLRPTTATSRPESSVYLCTGTRATVVRLAVPLARMLAMRRAAISFSDMMSRLNGLTPSRGMAHHAVVVFKGRAWDDDWW